MVESRVARRQFLKIAGASAAALNTAGGPEAAGPSLDPAPLPPDTKFPKLAMVTRYSPEKLTFAASAGYEGVVIPLDDFFDPHKLTDHQIEQILARARQAGVRIISIECMWGMNHIARGAAERRDARARFIRCLELGHRLDCKFVGTFSGGIPGASADEQVKEFAAVLNEEYLPVCEKLDLRMGTENYPTQENFSTVPAVWEKLMARVPNPRFGLEFDPSHLIRQFIDPIKTAWDFRERILAVHAKDTEIVEPVLLRTGIHGEGWWRYRIPGQGILDWPRFVNVLLQAGFRGGMAVEHEDDFWDEPPSDEAAEFPQARKDGFILAARYLRQFIPGRPL